jgi:hypothetical protein
MLHWSEGLWASGWYQDLEYALTRVGTADGPRAGFQEAYRAVVELAGGWFTYDRSGRRFVAGSYDELLARAREGSEESDCQAERTRA